MTKKYYFSLLILLVISFAGEAKPAATNLDKIVAIVNGDVITQVEVEKRMTMISRSAMNNPAIPLRKQALDSMIDSLLQMQVARRSGIQITESEIDNAVSNIAKKNNLSIEQLKNSLKEHEGLTFREYKEQIREQILISRIQQYSIGGDVSVKDEDIEKILRNPPKINNSATIQYHITDILIEIPDNTSPNQIKNTEIIAEQIATKLKRGANIEKLIQEYNTDKQNVSNNDLGWRRLDEIPTLFAKKIAAMQAGQITEPLKAPNGLHLVKLLEKQESQTQSIKFTKDQAREFALHQKLQENLKPWLKELRSKAYIKIID